MELYISCAQNVATQCFKLFLYLSIYYFLNSQPVIAQIETDDSLTILPEEISSFSLEELMNIQVTSVSKAPENQSKAAAAIFVITQDDIRSSGVTTIADALRMVPGMEVFRLDASKWAVSARGFSDRFAYKMLVLFDGREVYTPLFSGVYWEFQDYPLEDIERIEVIRGPGASLWGSNAVNGVINIITKDAEETQGSLVSSVVSTEEYHGTIRHGGTIGDDTFYRIFSKYRNFDDYVFPNGQDSADEWDMVQSGFRIDSTIDDLNTIHFHGNVFTGDLGNTYQLIQPLAPYLIPLNTKDDFSGANLLTKWDHEISEISTLSLQAYYDWYERDSLVFSEERHTFDIELEHALLAGDNHDVLWGGRYRLTTDEIPNNAVFQFDPNSRTSHLFSAFVQDRITLIDDTLFFTIGSKFEHNDYTGFEIQPSARLSWSVAEKHTLWTAVSRAVRTPSRIEHDGVLQFDALPPGSVNNPFPVPILLGASGNRNFVSEELIAYELGYRSLWSDWLSTDIALFYNDYDELLTDEPTNIEARNNPDHLFVPITNGNKMTGESYGVELAANIKATDWWQWKLAYTFIQIQLHPHLSSFTTEFETFEDRSPHHQVSLRSIMDVGDHSEFSVWLRYMDNIPEFDVSAYIELDARWEWHMTDDIDVAFGIQNVLDNRKQEFARELLSFSSIEREHNFYTKVTWRF